MKKWVEQTIENALDWLLDPEDADVSVQYQVRRDLLDQHDPALQQRIAEEGWCHHILSRRGQDGPIPYHWGQRYYQPKWISTHYTLLELKSLALAPGHPWVLETLQHVLAENNAPDGGVLPIGDEKKSDVCVNGMFLNFASYFGADLAALESVIDMILQEHMPDGGFNCVSNRTYGKRRPHHSSLHTTLSVMEGFWEYLQQGGRYREQEIQAAYASSLAFLQQHQLFISDRTGEVINKDFLRLAFPGRWRYDILRCLDHLRDSGQRMDASYERAIDVLWQKCTKDERWKMQAKHPGQQHLELEKAGRTSRINTLRALRVLRHFQK